MVTESEVMLSKDFSLYELLRSGTASKMGFREQFDPSEEILQNLANLCKNVLQPLRDYVRMPIKVTSGYRCEKLNKAIGGAKNSQHLTGCAADIQAIGKVSNNDLFAAIKASKVPADQVIVEFRDHKGEPSWIHISWSENPRGEFLEAYKQDGVTKYKRI